MEKKTIFKFSKDFKKLSRIAKLINLELLENDYVFQYSEFSLSLVKSLSVRTKLAGFVLLKTLLRFGDLYNFDLQLATNTRTFSIFQNKTGKPISKNFLIILQPLKYELATFARFHETLNYNMLSNEIDRFVRQHPFFHNVDWKKSAHIFRHVESSFRYANDVPISDIAQALGDSENITKNSYIHRDLNIFFLS